MTVTVLLAALRDSGCIFLTSITVLLSTARLPCHHFVLISAAYAIPEGAPARATSAVSVIGHISWPVRCAVSLRLAAVLRRFLVFFMLHCRRNYHHDDRVHPPTPSQRPGLNPELRVSLVLQCGATPRHCPRAVPHHNFTASADAASHFCVRAYATAARRTDRQGTAQAARPGFSVATYSIERSGPNCRMPHARIVGQNREHYLCV